MVDPGLIFVGACLQAMRDGWVGVSCNRLQAGSYKREGSGRPRQVSLAMIVIPGLASRQEGATGAKEASGNLLGFVASSATLA
jgi:hypothetical protein